MRFIISICLLTALSACGGGGSSSDEPITPAPLPMPAPAPPVNNDAMVTAGQAVFTTASANGNQFACASCHSPQENAEGLSSDDQLHRPAPPLFNSSKLTSFHNGLNNNLFDAVNICREDWMDASLFSQGSDQWNNLTAYLESLGDDNEAMPITTTKIEALTVFTEADADNGQRIFNETCAACHGNNAQGTDLARPLNAMSFTSSQQGSEFIANKVRNSGPQTHQVFAGLSGGNMPFWSQERLSDDSLKDVTRYLIELNAPDTNTLRCNDMDHPKVGLVANLTTIAHNVSGRAEIIDNCTIEITNFNYDGEGPAVLFYGGLNSDYTNGFGIGSRLDGTVFENATMRISLSSPSVLDRMDGLSVWCFEFNASFGQGDFQ